MARRAFTLIELLVVISIVALLSSTVLASLTAAREKGRLGAAKYFAAQTDHIAGDQAVLMWDFDDCSSSVAADRSGFGYDGASTASPTVSTNTPSGTGCALAYNGSTQYTRVPSNQDIRLTTGTVSAWVKTAGAGTGYRGIVVLRTYYSLHLVDNVLTTYDWAAPGGRSAGVNLADDKWHYVAMSFDSGVSNGTNIYVDGKLVKTLTLTVLGGELNPLYVGSENGTELLAGSVDGVRVFARTLSASEIGKLYAEGASGRFASAR